MQWSMIGWSHHRTPVEVREQLAFSHQQINDALQKLTKEFPNLEAVLLSTCNRVELYCAAAKADQLPTPTFLGQFLSGYRGVVYGEVKS